MFANKLRQDYHIDNPEGPAFIPLFLLRRVIYYRLRAAKYGNIDFIFLKIL